MSTYHILKETEDKKTYSLVSSGLLEPNDFAWGDIKDYPHGSVEANIGRKQLAGFLGSSWSRRGFHHSIKANEKIFAIDLETKEKIPVFTVNDDESWTDLTYKPY